ncbi:MAG: acetate--CoA ligase family protein [Gammaproteobacteria bacterium]|nr:acetate--CoA ligase family protein [Gammaproteobacteria bacterium]
MNSSKPSTETSGIEYLYNPRSIAIVGASPHQRKPGGRPLVALKARGYKGTFVAVNPRYDEIDGIPCYPSLLEVPEDIELAVLSVPAAQVLKVLQDGVVKGIKAAVIFTAGFSEVDAEGAALQGEITELAQKHGIRLLGPNCLGLMNLTNSVMASFAHIMDLEPITPQTLAFVTQSGAFGAMIYAEATAAGVGFSSFASVGNEADAGFADCMEYLLDDPHAEVIGGYLEGARDGAKLRQVAERALQIGKPILILKVGRTGAGARAANSHTGSLAGDDEVYDAFFRQMGIIRINDLSELTAFVLLHRSGRNFEHTNIAILGGSGGHGVMLSDRCESLGLSVPEITGTTKQRLEEILPAFGSARNPIDLTAQAGRDPRMPFKCLEVLSIAEGIDIIFMQMFYSDERVAKKIIEIQNSTDKPIVVTARRNGGSESEDVGFEMLKEARIPVLFDGLQGAKAVADLSWYQRKVRRAREDAAKTTPAQPRTNPVADKLLQSGKQLTEFDCKQILQAYGIPVTREKLATSADEAVELAADLGFPVVLKVQSGQILHKTEADAIRLNLGSAAEVREAYEEILENAKKYAPDAEIQGLLVQEMLQGGVEVIVGVTRDPVFGPVIMFGLGGIFVEVLKDVSFRVAPLLRRDAEEMIEEIRGHRILQGVRGQPPVSREALIDVILKVSELVSAYKDDIAELDINPLLLFPDGACAVDALITSTSSGPV